MFELLTLLLRDFPVAMPVGAVIALCIVVWYIASTWTNISYMRASMVTTKDLKIALQQHQAESDDRYVLRSSLRALLAKYEKEDRKGGAAGVH